MKLRVRPLWLKLFSVALLSTGLTSPGLSSQNSLRAARPLMGHSRYRLPLTHVDYTHLPVPEKFKTVPTAQVVWTNQPLITKDFAWDAQRTPQILLSTTGISLALAAEGKNDTSTHPLRPFATDELAQSGAHRPHSYGRALVFEVPGGKLIDAKGCGVKDEVRSYSNPGLMDLKDCLRETYYEQIVQRIFRQQGIAGATVASYCIISLGIISEEIGPCGMYLRQAHRRKIHDSSVSVDQQKLYQQWMKKIQKIARKYALDLDNQMAENGEIVDFGNWNVAEDSPLYIPDEEFEELATAISEGRRTPVQVGAALWRHIESSQEFIARQ